MSVQGTRTTVDEGRTLGFRDQRVGLSQISPDLALGNLRIVDIDVCLLGLEVIDEGDGSRFTSIASIGLEGESENSDALKQNKVVSVCDK